MNDTSFSRRRGVKPSIPAQERKRLEAITDVQAEAGARDDPDNQPLSETQLRRMMVAREVRRVRETAGLSQTQFAERYRLGLSRLRDWEQGRFAPDFVAMAFLQLIVDHPEIAAALVDKVEKGHMAA